MPMMGHKGLRRNDITALLLIGLVSLAPIPLGSNRPGLWVITDMLVFAIFLAQTVMRAFDTDDRSRFLPRNRMIIILFIITLVWHCIQVLPVGAILPGPETGLGGFGETISLVPGQTVLMALNFLAYGVVFILAYQIGQRPDRALRLFSWTGYMIGAFALYALYNFAAEHNALLGLPREFYLGDAAGTFVNRNSFATFLGLGLVLNIGLVGEAIFGALSERRRPALQTVLLHALVAAVLLAGILATHSRMGLFASLFGAVICWVLMMARSGIGWRIKAGGIVPVVLGMIIIAVLYGQGLFERLGSSQTDFDVRADLYRQVWELIWERPWSGFGAGTFEAAFPLVHHLPVSPDLLWDKAHNTYLTLFAELGLVVGALPVLIFLVLVVRFARALSSGPVARLGAGIGLGVLVQVGVHSLVDFSLEIHAVALLFVFLMGIGTAATGKGLRS